MSAYYNIIPSSSSSSFATIILSPSSRLSSSLSTIYSTVLAFLQPDLLSNSSKPISANSFDSTSTLATSTTTSSPGDVIYENECCFHRLTNDAWTKGASMDRSTAPQPSFVLDTGVFCDSPQSMFSDAFESGSTMTTWTTTSSLGDLVGDDECYFRKVTNDAWLDCTPYVDESAATSPAFILDTGVLCDSPQSICAGTFGSTIQSTYGIGIEHGRAFRRSSTTSSFRNPLCEEDGYAWVVDEVAVEAVGPTAEVSLLAERLEEKEDKKEMKMKRSVVKKGKVDAWIRRVLHF